MFGVLSNAETTPRFITLMILSRLVLCIKQAKKNIYVYLQRETRKM